MKGIRIGPPKTSPKRIEATERQLFAINLRKQGWNYYDMARQMGCSPANACDLVKRGLKNMLRAPAEELRTLEYERLQAIMKVLWTRVQKGNLGAIGMALRTSAQIAELMGLNIQVKGPGDTGITLTQLILSVHEAIPQSERLKVIEGKAEEANGNGMDGGERIEIRSEEVDQATQQIRP